MPFHDMTPARVDDIWETICYLGCTGETFRTRDIEQELQRLGFKPKTAELYFNRFVQYAMAHPEEFSGPKSKLVRVSRGVYQLDDNPER